MRNLHVILLSAIFLIFFSLSSNSQNNDSIFLSERIANYNIDVSLDATKKVLTGNMEIQWINSSSDSLNELQLHVYMNAFKNSASTFMKESRGQLLGNSLNSKNKMKWGWTDITKMRIKNGVNLIQKFKFIQPDDNNEHDQTVISIPLSNSLLPGDTIILEIDFKTKLPQIFARTGYHKNYYFVGQWFPKIGVYESEGDRYAETGQWNCHQFHRNSEFFADFGVYNVNITVPHNFVVGASGFLKDKKLNTDSTKTYAYLAEDVIDFAWTASPDFTVIKSNWKDVQINLLIQAEHLKTDKIHIESIKAALDYFDKHLGKYPYKTITIVDPPMGGFASSGMEYPTLITAGTIAGLPKGLKMTEMVVIHEFGHQYFMGILATNEFEEAWMDEGMNTYFETRIMDETYGEKTSFLDFLGITIGDTEQQRIGYVQNSKIAESYRAAWEYPHGGYGTMSYNKPATFLNTLDRLVGRKTIDKIFKHYYNKYKFKHPDSRDFIEVVNQVVIEDHGHKFGDDMNWFFDQLLYGSNSCDYELENISNAEQNNYIGYFDAGNEMKYENSSRDNKKYRSKVVLKRNGEIIMPVEVLIKFQNGEELLRNWDGKSRTKDFIFEGNSKIVSAQIDPENKILIDTNLNNNSKSTNNGKSGIWKYVLQLLFWLQNIMQSVTFLA